MSDDHVVDHLRGVRDRQMQRQQYRSALFISDKILARKESATLADKYSVAKCLYHLGEYHRAAYWLTTKCIDRELNSQLLLVKCYVSNFLVRNVCFGQF